MPQDTCWEENKNHVLSEHESRRVGLPGTLPQRRLPVLQEETGATAVRES